MSMTYRTDVYGFAPVGEIRTPKMLRFIGIATPMPIGVQTCPTDTYLTPVSPRFKIGEAKELPVEGSLTSPVEKYVKR